MSPSRGDCHQSVRRILRTVLMTIGVLTSFASQSFAQPTARATGKWEIEVHAGGAFGAQATDGDAIASFPVGPSFTTISLLPTRRAATWMFGDGAALANQLAARFTTVPVSGRITPLDPALTATGLERRAGAAFGVRVSRLLGSRLRAEFNLDSASQEVRLNEPLTKAIEATRSSFATTWNGIMATGGAAFVATAVSATANLTATETRRQTTMTGAIVIDIPMQGQLTPYVTVGIGMRSNSGDMPSATLTGNYRFQFFGVVPINETDLVTVHFDEKDRSVVSVFGGGIHWNLSERAGIRADYRVHVGNNSVRTMVDATPREAPGTPEDVIANGAVPIQFSNRSAVPGSLSAPAIAGLETFTGTGKQIQSAITAGYFFRF